jgi:hypothetical protein
MSKRRLIRVTDQQQQQEEDEDRKQVAELLAHFGMTPSSLAGFKNVNISLRGAAGQGAVVFGAPGEKAPPPPKIYIDPQSGSVFRVGTGAVGPNAIFIESHEEKKKKKRNVPKIKELNEEESQQSSVVEHDASKQSSIEDLQKTP